MRRKTPKSNNITRVDTLAHYYRNVKYASHTET